MIRNDGTPDEKKFLGIDLSIKKAPNNYIANNVDKKKEQLSNQLCLVSYIVAFIELHQQGYRIVQYANWSSGYQILKITVLMNLAMNTLLEVQNMHNIIVKCLANHIHVIH